MPKPIQREEQLLGGLWLQTLIVILLVFIYTQAIQQLRRQQELHTRLQEQLALCRDQAAKHAVRPDMVDLQAQVSELKSFLIPRGQLDHLEKVLRELASEQFGIEKVEVKVGPEPVQHLSVPLEDRPDFDVDLYPLEMSGAATTQQTAQLLERIANRSSRTLCALVGMEMKAAEQGSSQPVQIHLRWFVAVDPTAPESDGVSGLPKATSLPSKLQWGPRKEPFHSPSAD